MFSGNELEWGAGTGDKTELEVKLPEDHRQSLSRKHGEEITASYDLGLQSLGSWKMWMGLKMGRSWQQGGLEKG